MGQGRKAHADQELAMTMWMMGLPAIVLILGITLLVRGLRGRKVDDHPICRKCGFDLFGKPQGSNICSECGADLRGAHAIQQGRRVRKVGLIYAGATLLGLILFCGGVATYVTLSSTDWRASAPLWYLRAEADGLDPKARDAALTELLNRLGAGKFSQEQIDALLDQALAIQGDRKKSWVPAWGDLIEGAEAANKISPQRWEKYIVQAPDMSIAMRKELRRGDRLPYWVYTGNARVGSKSKINLSYMAKEWTIGSLHHKQTDFSSSGAMLNINGGSATGTTIDLAPELQTLSDGPQTIRFTFELRFSRAWNAQSMVTSTRELAGDLNLHPASESTVAINHDPALRAGVEKALTCSNMSYGQAWSPKSLNATIMVGGVPIGVGYDVYARIGGVGGKEVKIGSFACPKGTKDHGWSVGHEMPAFDEPTVDLILKPSVDAALGTIDTFEIWDGEIEIKNVAVKKMTPTTGPATSKKK